MWLITLLLKWQLNRAAHQVMEGRYIDRKRPQKGRFTRQQVNRFLDQTWRNVETMLPEARLDQLKSLGNRQNVFMALASLVGYRALLAEGIEPEYGTWSSSNRKNRKYDEFETEKVESNFQVISISRPDVLFAKLSAVNQKESSK